MAFRSHVFRAFDLGRWSNRLMFVLVGGAGAASVLLWVNGAPAEVVLAAGHVFVLWALVRELDPDHEWTALISGTFAGSWVLLQQPAPSLLPLVGLLMAARLVVNTTGRRPLLTDLIGLSVYATAISFTRMGWVAGFGLAVAIYVDERMADLDNPRAVLCAGGAALGATVVATAAQAFPSQVPDIDVLVVTAVGVVALTLILRPPPTPLSVVDSRMKTLIPQDRLHAGRSLTGVLVFISALVLGAEVERLYPLVAAMVIVLVSAEVERARRRQ